MANFGPKPWVNPFGKISIEIFLLFVFMQISSKYVAWGSFR